MAGLRIQLLTNPEGILLLWPWLKEVPVVNITHAAVLARCLDGTYTVITAHKDDELCGFMAYYLQGEDLVVVALYLPNQTREFLDEFMAWCRELKVKRFLALSTQDSKTYSRLFGLTYLYGFFMREVI